VQALLREDLVDELHLLVHPVVAGKGRRIFEDGGDPKRFELVDSKTLGTGVLDLTYRRERST
jgi:dihydrofolate reductase